jgi:hypothetical protein
MKVKIVNGTYGHRRTAGGSVVPIRMGGTVDVSLEEAKRLIRLGVAVSICGSDEPPVEPDQTEDGQKDSQDDAATLDREQLMELTRAKLEELAADMGVDVSTCKNKGEIADLLVQAPVEPGPELPDLGAEDPA